MAADRCRSNQGHQQDLTMNKTETCNLEGLPCGQHARIEGLSVGAELRARLAALGLQPGKGVEVVRRAWLGGPLHVRVGTTEIILRRQEAARIQVHPALALAA